MTVLLAAEAVEKRYRGPGAFGGGPARTVLRGVSLSVREGESVALLGASGSGKSTLARLMLGLDRPDGGTVRCLGRPLDGLDAAGRRTFRRTVQAVFQDPLGAVNPRHPVGRIIAEPLRHLTGLDRQGREARVAELLRLVGLEPEDAGRLPGGLSGGQVQRVCIARALAPQPRLILLDEAVSNLDLVLQIQILDLLAGLRERLGTAFLFITHDVRLVRRFCGRVAVLHEGELVEDRPAGPTLAFDHPAARALLEAVLPAAPSAARPSR
ncbi:nickel transport system ATP-binding protein [Azospirillum agricola]|uniref:nickel import ATP-binding protein NikE n=1 Tax=Azospirillum agricola TaxID=1720247 RepID=UPI001AE85401|nr:nickel import ATP-binding protein NikE [Azospirillum agricola]MBP2228380.1 nickel transport system ATP-binding protein [Azospirillum agricola]